MALGMKKTSEKSPLTSQPVEGLIHVIRGQKVMLDRDLAALYGVQTGALNQAVARNIERFPDDFMFRLNRDEFADWVSQFVISNPAGKMGLRQPPYAFTEHGVAMLSAVLRSQRAIEMSIAIMRTFVRMRELIASNREIATRLEKLEHSPERTGSVIEVLVEDIDRLAMDVKKMQAMPTPSRRKIGFDL